jgi:hypothetical protein
LLLSSFGSIGLSPGSGAGCSASLGCCSSTIGGSWTAGALASSAMIAAVACCCAAMRWLRRTSVMVSTTSVYFRVAPRGVVVPENCLSGAGMRSEFNEFRAVDTHAERSVSVLLSDDDTEVVKSRNGDSLVVSTVGRRSRELCCEVGSKGEKTSRLQGTEKGKKRLHKVVTSRRG